MFKKIIVSSLVLLGSFVGMVNVNASYDEVIEYNMGGVDVQGESILVDTITVSENTLVDFYFEYENCVVNGDVGLKLGAFTISDCVNGTTSNTGQVLVTTGTHQILVDGNLSAQSVFIDKVIVTTPREGSIMNGPMTRISNQTQLEANSVIGGSFGQIIVWFLAIALIAVMIGIFISFTRKR